jgi:SagB-type dehydrogenase family enzyme
MPDPADAVRIILSYHRRTKHHLHRYAPSPGSMDWANQPDPFRTYAGAPVVQLPLLADALTGSFGDLHVPGAIAPRRLDVNTIAILFELALGLSAWKEFKGSRWALRCNPSSGNLHPTEGYLITPTIAGLDAGVYHYVSRDHCLEQRNRLDAGSATALQQALGPDCFLVGLSSIHWREAWKYGERAYRYCQHDCGHALAALRYAAGCLGWSARLQDYHGDDAVSRVLGLDHEESYARVDELDREHPDCLLLLGPAQAISAGLAILPTLTGRWAGEANPLSAQHVLWEVIDHAAQAACKPPKGTHAWSNPAAPPLPSGPGLSAAKLIRQRRSCLDLDGQTSISAATFFNVLDHLLPRAGIAPWDMVPWPPHLHLFLFVHRVDGLPAGLYALERDQQVHDSLKAACKSAFRWERPAGCPEHLRLFFLAGGDARSAAKTLSCHQDIAADGAFSLAMVAEYGETIRHQGAWWYRRLFWEAGALGQVLYLQAEAAGIRGTGIGCYFDDASHQILRLEGDRFQDLYHFTMGGPVDDPRLQSFPAYAHLQR